MGEIALVKDGRPVAAIAVPEEEGHRHLAARVRDAVRDATDAQLPVISDVEAAASIGRRNLIVIGNLMTNKVAERLYHNYYVASDAVQPGPGRYELRTVHDPEALSVGIVFCGGSDAAGMEASVGRLLAHITPGSDLTVPHLVEMEVDKPPAPLSDEQLAGKLAEAKPPYGACDLLVEQGLNYYRTGNPAYLQSCKQAIPTLLPALKDETYLSNLYPIAYLGPVWDQIEEAPVFTDEERAAVCGFLLGCLEICPRLHELDAPREHPVHYGFAEKAGNLAALYLHRYCPGLPRAEETLRRLRHFYEMQSHFWKPANEANGYQTTYATEIALWCLTNGDLRYMQRGNLAKQCDYLMTAVISNVPYNTCFGDSGGLLTDTATNLLRIGAWYYKDGRYQWFNNFTRWGGWDWNLYHTYSTDVPPVEPTDIYGITVVAAEGWCHDAGANEPGAPPRERAYDKVVFRSRLDRQADYLLLDGLSGFNHGHADGNQIVNYTDKGLWALYSGGYMVKSLPEHNVVVVFRNGEGGIKKVPTLADLELKADLRDFGAVRSTLHSYNGTDWSRNILWSKGRYFLVIDEVRAVEPGEYVLQDWWKLFRKPTVLDGRAIVSGEDVQLHMQGLDDAALAQRVSLYKQDQCEASHTASLAPGECRAFMNLLQCTRLPHGDVLAARRLAEAAAVVRSPGGEVELLGSRPFRWEGDLSVSAQLYSIGPDAFSVVQGTVLHCGAALLDSDQPLTADCDLRRGRLALDAERPCRVTFAACEGPVRVDGRRVAEVAWSDGRLTLAVPSGAHRIQFAPPSDEQMAMVSETLQRAWGSATIPPPSAPRLQSDAPPMEQLWAWRGEQANESQPRLLTQADVNGDGHNELLMGAEDNCLRCFDGTGKVLWEYDAGTWVCSLWAGDLLGKGATELVVGTGRYPSQGGDIIILDAAGKELSRIASPTTPGTPNESWGAKPGAIEVIGAIDVDGDGAREIVAGSTNMHIYALRPNGEQVWERLNYAHRPNNMQFRDVNGDGREEITCTTSFYETNVYNLGGEMVFRVKNPGPGLQTADIDGDGTTEIVTGSRYGPVSVTKFDPALQFTDMTHTLPGIWAPAPAWSFDTGVDVDTVRLADLGGDGTTKIVACSRNSILYAFNADGSILWTRALGDCVRAVEVADLDGDGKPEVLAGNDAGQVFVVSADGVVLAQGQTPGLVEFIAARDVNGDGRLEVIVATDGPTLSAYTWPGL